MKEYPVGTICEIINLANESEYNGKEVTILSKYTVYEDKRHGGVKEGYQIDLMIDGFQIYANHKNLRPKKFPPDADFKKFMDNVLKPVEIVDEIVITVKSEGY